MSSRRSAVRAEAHKPFTGVSGGNPDAAVYLFWISLFSPLFNMRIQECNWIFKETGLPFCSGGGSCLPSVLKKKGPFAAVVWPLALRHQTPPASSQGPQRPGPSRGQGQV